jgi:hypothetical protein
VILEQLLWIKYDNTLFYFKLFLDILFSASIQGLNNSIQYTFCYGSVNRIEVPCAALSCSGIKRAKTKIQGQITQSGNSDQNHFFIDLFQL